MWKAAAFDVYRRATMPWRAWYMHRLIRRGAAPITILYYHRVADCDPVAVEPDASFGPHLSRVEEPLQELAGPGALQPSDAENLTSTNREANSVDGRFAARSVGSNREILDPEAFLADMRNMSGKLLVHLASHHPMHQLSRRKFACGGRTDQTAVPVTGTADLDV